MKRPLIILLGIGLTMVVGISTFAGRGSAHPTAANDGTVDEVVISASLVDMRTGTPTSSLVLHEGETVPIAWDVETFNDSNVTVKKKLQVIATIAPGTEIHCAIDGDLGDGHFQLQNDAKKNAHDWVPADKWPAKACSVGFLVGVLETCAPGFVDGEGGSHEVQVSKNIRFGTVQVHECKHWVGKSTKAVGLKGADIDRCNVTEPGSAAYKTLAGRRCIWDAIAAKEDAPQKPATHRIPGTEITALSGSAGTYIIDAGVLLEVEEAVDVNPDNNVLGFAYEIVICTDSDGDTIPDTPCPTNGGGIAEPIALGSDSTADTSGSSSARDYTVPIAAAAGVAALLALAAGGWYVRRRWLH